MNRDFVEMLAALSAAGVEFLIVGAYAMAAYGLPRATGDIDIWVQPTRENAERVMQALQAFGAPLFGLAIDDLLRSDTVFQIGIAPSRIDILTGISGVTFTEAWPNRMTVTIDNQVVPVIGVAELARNKAATGRAKDQADLIWLRERTKTGLA
jgi:hypothetical protein